MVTFTHNKLSEFWQSSEVTKVKSSLSLSSTLPLCWGDLVAVIAQVVSHSTDLRSPDAGKPSGKTPFVPPPQSLPQELNNYWFEVVIIIII